MKIPSTVRPISIHVMWQRLDQPGVEHCKLTELGDAVTMTGIATIRLDTCPGRLGYRIQTSAEWKFQSAHLQYESALGKTSLDIELQSGVWRVNGKVRPDLYGCDTIDLMGTPSTNSLPVRGWVWEPGQSRQLTMAYIRLPDFSVQPLEQSYTCLQEDKSTERGVVSVTDDRSCVAEQGQLFLYRSIGSGYQSLLRFDHHGLILHYPGCWRQVQPLEPGAEVFSHFKHLD